MNEVQFLSQGFSLWHVVAVTRHLVRHTFHPSAGMLTLRTGDAFSW